MLSFPSRYQVILWVYILNIYTECFIYHRIWGPGGRSGTIHHQFLPQPTRHESLDSLLSLMSVLTGNNSKPWSFLPFPKQTFNLGMKMKGYFLLNQQCRWAGLFCKNITPSRHFSGWFAWCQMISFFPLSISSSKYTTLSQITSSRGRRGSEMFSC